jgi:L-lactate dehydrogenase complex protein LldG
MPSESQAAFFARIQSALAERGPAFDLPDDLEVARVVPASQDLLATFLAKVEQSGMHPHRVTGEAAAISRVLEIVAELNARSAIVPAESFPAREDLVAVLQSKGIALLDADGPDSAFEADVGITGVRLAVAETASMSIVSGGTHRRLASLAVPAHIAILRADQIVPDLLDWGGRPLAPPPANEVLVSAMSKTADIEGILVPGVHGPGTVHVIVVE